MKRSMMLLKRSALLLFASVASVNAQKTETRALQITAYNITARAEVAAGIRSTAMKAVLPGDVIEYQLVFTNTTKKPVLHATFQDPVPSGLHFISGSARSTRGDIVVEFSADHGATWSEQPVREVIYDGGKLREPVPPALYTTLRWRVDGPLLPGATIEARFRARANAASSPLGRRS